ncbi:hypothetical protein D5086_004128 [Populus alba]|uniref:Uncharacterized protein n=1 Tax=Populus alba TaxID=43335 RepID=A0ACC4CRP3_POPAL
MALSDAVIGNLTTIYVAVIAGIKAYGLVCGRSFSGVFVLIVSTAVVGLILIGTLTWDISRKAMYAISQDRVNNVHEMCKGGICWHGVAVRSPASQSKIGSTAEMKWRLLLDNSKTKGIVQLSNSGQLSMFNYCRKERAPRKAEMEATKAENMIPYKDEIFSSPKRTWFVTEREKMLAAKQSSVEKEKGSGNEVMSAQQAEDLKMKEKRKRERETNASAIILKDVYVAGFDLAYSEAVKKALDAGKIVQKKAGKKSKPPPERTQSRTEEMRELFQSDMSERKQERSTGTRNRSPRIHLRANQEVTDFDHSKYWNEIRSSIPILSFQELQDINGFIIPPQVLEQSSLRMERGKFTSPQPFCSFQDPRKGILVVYQSGPQAEHKILQ